MSDYLSRLVQRAAITGERPTLQPFVRSRSPIAEHDQRLTMSAFDDVEPGMAPSIESGVKNHDPIKSTGHSSDATLQRKTAGPDASTPHAPSMNLSARHAASLISGDTPLDHGGRSAGLVALDMAPTGSRADGTTSPPSTVGTELRSETSPFQTTSPPGPVAEPQHDARDEIGESTPATRADAVFTSPGRRPPESRGSDSESTAPDSARSEVSYLEPARRPRIEAEETIGATEPGSDDTPRVVIGRINVEVIPSPAAHASAPPSSKPLTAAAASVIGPLGDSVPRNLRLSLRHR